MSIATNYDNIWKILSEYHMQYEYELNDNFKCTICKELLKNGCYSTCGCKYCLNCIRAYLNEEEKYCPNLLDYCRKEMINLERDIQIDHITNMKISKLRATCPIESCTHLDELKNMNDHLKTHKLACPYFNMGCVQEDISANTMNDHLEDNRVYHYQLIDQSCNNLENEISSEKDEAWKNQNRLSQLYEKVKEAENINKSLNEELLKLIGINARLENDLREKDPNVEVARNLKTNILSKSPLASSNRKKQVRPKKTPPKYMPFLWKVGELSKKRMEAKAGRNTVIRSEPFYTHPKGYKLCLVLYPNGVGSGINTHLSLGFQIMKGQYDDTLNWPMLVVLVLSLKNKILGEYQFFKLFGVLLSLNQTRFMKPTTEMNDPVGKPKYIEYKTLYRDPDIYLHDSIDIVAILNG